MATKKYDAVAKIIEDRNGTEKVRWHTIGPVFEGEKGLSLKIESLPVGPWNGWVSFFEPKEKEAAKPAAKAKPVYKGDDEQDTPF